LQRYNQIQKISLLSKFSMVLTRSISERKILKNKLTGTMRWQTRRKTATKGAIISISPKQVLDCLQALTSTALRMEALKVRASHRVKMEELAWQQEMILQLMASQDQCMNVWIWDFFRKFSNPKLLFFLKWALFGSSRPSSKKY